MIVYIETNFLVGAATGRDSAASDLLRVPSTQLRIVIPSICVMEATSWYEGERKRRHEWGDRMAREVPELRRAVGSAESARLLASLEQSKIFNANLVEEIGARLGWTLSTIAGLLYPDGTRSAELISATAESITPNYLGRNMSEPTDELVLVSIVEHARNSLDEEKALLTGNSRDFDVPSVREILKSAGIDRVFPRTEAFLGWFSSLP